MAAGYAAAEHPWMRRDDTPCFAGLEVVSKRARSYLGARLNEWKDKTMALELKIIVGSTRPGRQGPKIAAWIESAAKARGDFNVTLIDLAEINLPLLNEPNHPVMQQYQHDATKAWAEAIGSADALVFVTPEYDSFPNAALVNAVQYLAVEWRYKPAAIVSYGGISGGLRAAQELRQLLGAVGTAVTPQGVPLPMVFGQLNEAGFEPTEINSQGAEQMLSELGKWASALQPLHKAA